MVGPVVIYSHACSFGMGGGLSTAGGELRVLQVDCWLRGGRGKKVSRVHTLLKHSLRHCLVGQRKSGHVVGMCCDKEADGRGRESQAGRQSHGDGKGKGHRPRDCLLQKGTNKICAAIGTQSLVWFAEGKAEGGR